MGKKSRVKQRSQPADGARESGPEGSDAGPVAPRQPCPCGSGRRYRNCHGRADGGPAPFVARTFEGLPGECDWVALREIVPAATAPLALRPGVGDDSDVTVCSLLPLATPALVRSDGSVLLGLQVRAQYGDASRDLAHALELALAADPGQQVDLPGQPPEGPRLQQLVDPVAPFDVTVHAGFDYWVSDRDDPDADVAAALQSANDAASPTVRLEGVEAAYWTRMGEREFVRWVRPEDETRLLDALARLHAAGADGLGGSSRLLGMFRAHGLLTPVWEVPLGTGADGLATDVGPLSDRLDGALAQDAPLTAEQRAARNGLANRQLTIR